MAYTYEDINTRVEAAVTAMDAGDYTTAREKLETASVMLAGLPDSKKGNSELQWDREAIDKMLARVAERETRSSAGVSGWMQSTKVVGTAVSAE